MTAAASTARRPTFADVFAVTEYRALWLAQLLSVAGDQLARVAMTVLVYDRTGSPLLTALTYAVTFLPWMIGGVGLSGIADRLPRRQVMIACDVARMALVVLMAVLVLTAPPGPWLLGMVALLFLVTLLDSPFKSARSAMIPDILDGELYVLGTAVSQITLQAGMVAGFALGGVVVAAAGPAGALLIDAVTFAASAALVWLWVRTRPVAAPAGHPSQASEIAAGIRLVFGDPRLRTLVLFGWLVTFYIVPMGLAVPYAATFRGLPTPVIAGLLFAAGPFGSALGAVAFGRLVPPGRRLRWMGPLAVGSCAALIACWVRPGLVLVLAILVLSGACAAYQLAANAAFVAAVPPARRGQAFGLANGGMQVFQGLWFIVAGAVAELVGINVVIAASGVLGAVAAVALTATWRALGTAGPGR